MSILTCFFLALVPYAASITFNFTNITTKNSQDIVLLDHAYISDEGIQVSKNSYGDHGWTWLAGRATYIIPLHLWGNSSAYLASFSTSFTFVIDSYGNDYHGEGLTFFLAQENDMTNLGGGSIGLPFNYSTNAGIYPFVAVEFDTNARNKWDPRDPGTSNPIGDHIGININSMTSVMYRKWLSNITHGKECRALINYYSDSKILNVSFTSFKDNLLVWETGLYHHIDLRDVLPEYVIFGFSASTGDGYEKNNVRSWSFTSSEFKAGENNRLTPPTNLKVVKGKDNTLREVEIIAGTLALVAIVLAIVAYIYCRRKRYDGDKVEELEFASEMNNDIEIRAPLPRRFSYHELALSTANFAETDKLGEGGFGGVYKGFMKDLSIHVAVKRVSKTSKQGIKEYASEVKIISRLRHRNLVQLIGWCHDKEELLIAYEYMENGSLDLHLFKGKSLLTWNTRYKIALGLASALLYLHEEWEQCVLHRDIKSSNVMLDSNFNAKLGDFGLAKLVDHEKGSQTTMLAGTLGYMAPECVVTGSATRESDVFSFGVVLLEVACGRRTIEHMAQEKQIRLLEWVWELYGAGALLKAVDPSLGSCFDEGEIKRLMILGLWCVHPSSQLRPTMSQVIKVLKSEASLPLLPSNMPVACYLTTSVPSPSDFLSVGQHQLSSNISNSSKQALSTTSSSCLSESTQ